MFQDWLLEIYLALDKTQRSYEVVRESVTSLECVTSRKRYASGMSILYSVKPGPVPTCSLLMIGGIYSFLKRSSNPPKPGCGKRPSLAAEFLPGLRVVL